MRFLLGVDCEALHVDIDPESGTPREPEIGYFFCPRAALENARTRYNRLVLLAKQTLPTCGSYHAHVGAASPKVG